MTTHSGTGSLSTNLGSGRQHNTSISGGHRNSQYNAENLTVHNHAPFSESHDAAQLRRAIFLTDPEIDRNNLVEAKGERVAGTCEWINDDETYCTWLAGKTGLLWICGGPGIGKTMLSIYLTHQLARGHQLIYFFCNGQDEKRNNAAGVLRTLLWQLTEKHEDTVEQLAKFLADPERRQATMTSGETLWSMFVELLDKVVTRSELPFICLIDGMDECDQESTRWLCTKFTDLCYNRKRSPALKVIIISREVNGLGRATKIELDSNSNSKTTDDVATFISKSVQKLATEMHISAGICQHIEAILHAKSEGTFLWVGFVFQELRGFGTGIEMLRALRTMPNGLSALYQRILARIEARKSKKSVAILHWVAMSYRPLCLDELAAAVECHPQDLQHATEFIRDEVAICAPLLEMRQESVGFVHQSAKDYLMRTQNAELPALQKYYIHHEDAHFYLARRCIQSLSSRNMLVEYASKHWVDHTKQLGQLGHLLVSQERAFFGRFSPARDTWWRIWSSEYDSPRLHMACYLGLSAWVKAIIKEERHLLRAGYIEKLDVWHRTPLMCAINSRSLSVIKQILDNGADANVLCDSACVVNFRALEMEARWPLYYTTNICGKFDGPLPRTPKTRRITPLCYAVLEVAVRSAIFYDSWRPPPPTEDEETGLDIIQLLLDYGANPSGAGALDTTPLCAAAIGRREAVMRMLLDHGANPDETASEPYTGGRRGQTSFWRSESPICSRELTAMHLAAGYGDTAIVKLLAEHGANLDAKTREGDTPITLAMRRRNPGLEVIKLLLSLGAVPYKRLFVASADGGPSNIMYIPE